MSVSTKGSQNRWTEMVLLYDVGTEWVVTILGEVLEKMASYQFFFLNSVIE